jgi:hypothetical protein
MIPKYIFDKSQTTLINISIKNRLLKYRELLYYDLKEKLKILSMQKIALIKSYFIAIKEIDLELQSLNKKEKK